MAKAGYTTKKRSLTRAQLREMTRILKASEKLGAGWTRAELDAQQSSPRR